jgi:Mrp family chromosome partitioning ATPase
MNAAPKIAKWRPFSLVEVLLHLLRRWYIVLLVGALGSATTFLLKDRFRPAYRSEASVRITRALKAPQLDANVYIPKEDPIEPEGLARTMLEEATTSTSLDKLFAAHPSLFAEELRRGRARYADYLRKHASVKPRTDTLYGVEAWSWTPEEARGVTDWIATSAMATYQRLMLERSQTLARFTKAQSEQAARDLEKHQEKMVAFLKLNPVLLVSALTQDRRLAASGPDRLRVEATRRVLQVAGSAIGAGDAGLKALLEERTRLQAERRSLESATPSEGASKLGELQQAQSQLNQLRAQGLGDEHPSVKQAMRRVARLEAEAKAVRPGQATKAGDLNARVQSKLKEIDRKIQGKLKRTQAMPRQEAQWGELEREHRLLLQHQEGFARLAATAAFRSGLGAFESKDLARIADEAGLPTAPKGARLWMVIAAGIAFSFLLGAAAAVLIGCFDRKLYAPAEVKSLVGVPLLAQLARQGRAEAQRAAHVKQPAVNEKLLAWSRTEEDTVVGVRPPEQKQGADGRRLLGGHERLALPAHKQESLVPAQSMIMGDLLGVEQTFDLRIRSVIASAPLAPGVFVSNAPRSQGADQMRLLASRLQDVHESPFHIIVVASWEPQAGRSTIAANLALALAEARRRTLLIDCCEGDGTLTRLLGLRPEASTTLYEQLSARLAGTMETWTVHKVAEALSVIPAGTVRRPMGPMLSSVAFTELVGQMRTVYDVLLFDCLPLGRSSDAVILHQQADAVVLALRRRRSTLSGAAKVLHELGHERLVGAVFNAH